VVQAEGHRDPSARYAVDATGTPGQAVTDLHKAQSVSAEIAANRSMAGQTTASFIAAPAAWLLLVLSFADGRPSRRQDAATRTRRYGMMRSILAPVLGLVLALSGAIATAENYPADNTGKNVRDKDARTLTPTDQSNDEGDVKVTQEIRKAVVDDDSLSTSAHNVKIITIAGKVTLRGPVATTAEREKIQAIATQVAGPGKVTNELEVASR
jgi:hypothetical protein